MSIFQDTAQLTNLTCDLHVELVANIVGEFGVDQLEVVIVYPVGQGDSSREDEVTADRCRIGTELESPLGACSLCGGFPWDVHTAAPSRAWEAQLCHEHHSTTDQSVVFSTEKKSIPKR